MVTLVAGPSGSMYLLRVVSSSWVIGSKQRWSPARPRAELYCCARSSESHGWTRTRDGTDPTPTPEMSTRNSQIHNARTLRLKRWKPAARYKYRHIEHLFHCLL